jgi:uncharacterized protein YbjQ (UPF0145 family)
MTESTGPSAAAFPVTTAFELMGQGLTEIVAYGTAVMVRPTTA